ncbi:MAG: helix-turn-helix domain-containing protein, partial [Desulfobacterales bacterium]
TAQNQGYLGNSSPGNVTPLVHGELINLDFENGAKTNSLSLKKVRKKVLDHVEREVITYVLSKTGWNRSKATKILNISYKTLLYKIKDLNIDPPEGADLNQEL